MLNNEVRKYAFVPQNAKKGNYKLGYGFSKIEKNQGYAQ